MSCEYMSNVACRGSHSVMNMDVLYDAESGAFRNVSGLSRKSLRRCRDHFSEPKRSRRARRPLLQYNRPWTAHEPQRSKQSLFWRPGALSKTIHQSVLIVRSTTALRARRLARNGCCAAPRNVLRRRHFRVVPGVYVATDLKTERGGSNWAWGI